MADRLGYTENKTDEPGRYFVVKNPHGDKPYPFEVIDKEQCVVVDAYKNLDAARGMAEKLSALGEDGQIDW